MADSVAAEEREGGVVLCASDLVHWGTPIG